MAAIADQLQELSIKKNLSLFTVIACFLTVGFMMFFNIQRMVFLEHEVQQLRHAIMECDRFSKNGFKINKDQINIRNRRNIQDSDLSKPVYKSLDSNDFFTSNTEEEFPLLQNEGVISRKPHSRMQILDERHPRTGRIKPLPSVHLNGDTSSYVLGTHENFNGNGHLRHTQRIFVDWKPSSWAESTGMMTHFDYNEGYLTIKESGLYLVYAQIYYLDEHDLNGYRVFKNDKMILQCTVSLHSGTRVQKGNTCYTAGVEYIAEGDKISLGDILHDHYSLFEPGKSFFGLIKLGDVRGRV
ncbi:hypothetical protein ABEB36_011330 [Hypothenemus hampei]|uniref:THD domain-containing protein n=1 Tax=Hypothenemus hampei TaxID=57062 RepID=A0ABD1EF19_HYPHA